MAFVREPTSKKPRSRMPGFDGKIAEADLRALAEYLASLK
jgi:mono/diheme cytochrome c family protein